VGALADVKDRCISHVKPKFVLGLRIRKPNTQPQIDRRQIGPKGVNGRMLIFDRMMISDTREGPRLHNNWPFDCITTIVV
jgi:hypothetical protein